MDRHATPRTPRSGAVAALAVLAALLPGCVMRIQRAAMLDVTPAADAAPPRPELPTRDLPWPERWGGRGDLRGVVLPVEGPLSVWQGVWLGEHHAWRTRDIEYADAAALGAAFGEPSGFKFQTEGPGSFLFVRDRRFAEPDPPPVPQPTDADPAEMFKFVSAKVTRTWERVPGVELQRTWFGLYDPSPPRAEKPLGTIVLLPGMFGTPEPVIDSLVKSMRDRGWTVLRMLSHPSRFTERLEVHVDADDPDPAAEVFADELTDRAAECAYAARAALAHTFELRPALEDRPTVLMGMSGGAIALPTVNAYDPDAYDAAVLIAGGVNFLGINLESNYAAFIDAIHAQFGDVSRPPRDPRPDERAALAEAYLRHAELDGYRLAERLADKPTLVIHASGDRAVPAHYGDQLWERAGRPERWVFPVGHELVFLALPTQAGRIHRWLVEQLDLDPALAAEPHGGGA